MTAKVIFSKRESEDISYGKSAPPEPLKSKFCGI